MLIKLKKKYLNVADSWGLHACGGGSPCRCVKRD